MSYSPSHWACLHITLYSKQKLAEVIRAIEKRPRHYHKIYAQGSRMRCSTSSLRYDSFLAMMIYRSVLRLYNFSFWKVNHGAFGRRLDLGRGRARGIAFSRCRARVPKLASGISRTPQGPLPYSIPPSLALIEPFHTIPSLHTTGSWSPNLDIISSINSRFRNRERPTTFTYGTTASVDFLILGTCIETCSSITGYGYEWRQWRGDCCERTYDTKVSQIQPSFYRPCDCCARS